MLKKIGETVGNFAKDTIGEGVFNRTIGRLFNSGIWKRNNNIKRATARWSDRDDKRDWRVKLTIPEKSELRQYFFPAGTNERDNRLAPLSDIGGIFWPLTPSMVIQHSANYDALAMAHSNYPFQAYQNSQVDQMNIIGEFPVQNQQDAVMWVATVNFLRTVTKMFFGQKDRGTNFKGSPPPILHLSGYGDNMFNKVPVVVNTFNVELRAGIDYISTRQDFTGFSIPNREKAIMKDYSFDANSFDQTWAPSLSNISVLVTPVYSRETVKKFNLRDFARGDLNGTTGDGIGFI